MKLRTYPTKINNVAIPQKPNSWSAIREVIENVGVTEAGTDIVDIKRVGKLTISVSYNCSSNWLVQFQSWADETSALTVQIYDPSTLAYENKSMRIRNFNEELVPNSENVSGTLGLYIVSFDLIEF